MICERCSSELNLANKIFNYSSVSHANFNITCDACGHTQEFREVLSFEVYKMERTKRDLSKLLESEAGKSFNAFSKRQKI